MPSEHVPAVSKDDLRNALRALCDALLAHANARPYWQPVPQLHDAWADASRIMRSEERRADLRWGREASEDAHDEPVAPRVVAGRIRCAICKSARPASEYQGRGRTLRSCARCRARAAQYESARRAR